MPAHLLVSQLHSTTVLHLACTSAPLIKAASVLTVPSPSPLPLLVSLSSLPLPFLREAVPRLVRLPSPLLLRELAAPLLVYPSQAQSLLPALVHLSQALQLLPVPVHLNPVQLLLPASVHLSQALQLLPVPVHPSQALLLLLVPQPSLALPHLKVPHLSLSLALLLQVALRPNLFRAHSLNLPQAHPLSQLQALLPSQPRALPLNLLPNLLLSQLQFQALPPNPPRVLPPSQPLLRLALLNPLAPMPHPALSAPLDP